MLRYQPETTLREWLEEAAKEAAEMLDSNDLGDVSRPQASRLALLIRQAREAAGFVDTEG